MTLASHLRKDLGLTLRDRKGVAIALALPVVIVWVYTRLDLATLAGYGANADAFILVISATFPVLLVASTALVEERRLGTFGRLARSPANTFAVVASKSIVASGLLVLQVAVLLVAAVVPLADSSPGLAERPGTVALVLVFAGLAAHAVGLLLGAVSSTETQAMQLASLAFLVMFTLSGFLQPLDRVPTVGPVAAYAPVALGYAGTKAAIAGKSAVPALVGLPLVAVVLVLASGLTAAWRKQRS